MVYRYVDPAQRDPYSPETALSQVCERLVSALNGAGVVAERQSGEQIHARLLRWFNPAPQWVERRCSTAPLAITTIIVTSCR